MNLATLLFVLFFVALVVCGALVNAYLYANDAFKNGGKVRRSRKPPLSVASFSQTATLPTLAEVSELHHGGVRVRHHKDAANINVHRFMLYSIIGILLIFVLLVVLVLNVTQF